MKLDDSIREYVRENKISQKVLATNAGLSENALSLFLNGKRRLLADEYIRICNALCVSYDRFANDTDQKPA